MNRPQRVVLITYFMLIVYCTLWVPWRVLTAPEGVYERVGYGLVWAGPYRSPPVIYKQATETADGLKILQEEDPNSSWRDLNAEPDLRLLVIRILAVTAIFATVYLLVGSWMPQPRRL